MNRLKRIQKDVRMGWMLKDAGAAVVIAAVIWLILLGMHETSKILLIAVGCLILLAVFALIGLVTGSVRAGRIKKRVQSMGSDLDEDVFEKAGDCLYIGNEWLAYRRKEDWLLWRRNEVYRIVIRSRNAAGTRADIVVYQKGSFAGEAFRINGTSSQQLQRIENWAYTD